MIRRNRKVIVNPFTVIVNPVACQPSTIHRRFGVIHRFGCRDQSVESSDNRQIAPFLRRPSGLANRQLILNRFPVIVNRAALNPSRNHHQNAEIYYRAGSSPAIRVLESSDNHPTKRRNHPTDSANLPIIYRRIPVNYRSGQATNCT